MTRNQGVADIRCTVNSGRRRPAQTRTTLQDIIRAVSSELQEDDHRKVADIVMYLLETGRVKIDSAAND